MNAGDVTSPGWPAPGARPWRLGQAHGVELEYMIVDTAALAVRPICDQLLTDVGAGWGEEAQAIGPLVWVNELCAHVIEFAAEQPAAKLAGLSSYYQDAVVTANRHLGRRGARLLPTGAHPWFDPARETVLWPHDGQEIYATFDRIFGCHGHGWSNLQSAHLNLSFSGDEEFRRLHAAIRLVLPLVPALAASTPYLDGRSTGLLSARLDVYRHNQDRLPIVTDGVIPATLRSFAEYEAQVFKPIAAAVAPQDPEHILQPEWTNARGAIARFSRGAIEVRVVDLQECPAADLAVLRAIAAAISTLVAAGGRIPPLGDQEDTPTGALRDLLDRSIRDGAAAELGSWADFWRPWVPGAWTVGDLWRNWMSGPLAEAWGDEVSPAARAETQALRLILAEGPLATRLHRAAGSHPTRERLHSLYRDLADHLQAGSCYRP